MHPCQKNSQKLSKQTKAVEFEQAIYQFFSTKKASSVRRIVLSFHIKTIGLFFHDGGFDDENLQTEKGKAKLLLTKSCFIGGGVKKQNFHIYI
jgi:hypothetical protein